MGVPASSAEVERGLAAIRENGGDIVAAARQIGRPDRTLRDWVKKAERDTGIKFEVAQPTVAEIAALQEALKMARRPIYTVRHDTASGEKIRMVVIGDAHDDPKIDKQRFEWIGAHIDAVKPDIVVQIGDFLNMDSLNTHVPDHTFNGKGKPTFMADINSFRLALDAIESKLNHQPEKHVTLGNHERRLFLAEDNAPATFGMMQAELQLSLEGRKWSYSPYGEITMYGGVGFVHAALNTLGKTYGGKNAETTICNDSVFDLVIGHSHRYRDWNAPKLGRGNFVTVLNVGCALPSDHVEQYAQHALTGWSWGVADITVRGGHIKDHQFTSMDTLEERYGGR